MSHNKEDFILEAIENNDVDSIKKFTVEELNEIRIDTYICSPDCHHHNPLIMRAVQCDRITIAKTMIEMGCDLDDEFMFIHVRSIEMLQLLVKHVDKSKKYHLSDFILDSIENTKLVYDNGITTIIANHFIHDSSNEVFEYVMTKIDIHEKMKNGNSILNITVSLGNMEKVKLLVKMGIDVNEEIIIRNCGSTEIVNALSTAIYYSPGKVEYLLSVGCDINSVPSNKVHYSFRNVDSSIQMLKCLIKNGYDIDEKDSDGRTCFIRSLCGIFGRSKKELKLFIETMKEFGSDVFVKNNKNMNAIHVVIDSSLSYNLHKLKDIISLLLELGISIHDIDDNGNTPVCYILNEWCYLDSYDNGFVDLNTNESLNSLKSANNLVEFLLDNGFDPNLTKPCSLQKLCAPFTYEDESDSSEDEDDICNERVCKILNMILEKTTDDNIEKVLNLNNLDEIIFDIISKHTLKRRSQRTKSAVKN